MAESATPTYIDLALKGGIAALLAFFLVRVYDDKEATHQRVEKLAETSVQVISEIRAATDASTRKMDELVSELRADRWGSPTMRHGANQ